MPDQLRNKVDKVFNDIKNRYKTFMATIGMLNDSHNLASCVFGLFTFDDTLCPSLPEFPLVEGHCIPNSFIISKRL